MFQRVSPSGTSADGLERHDRDLAVGDAGVLLVVAVHRDGAVPQLAALVRGRQRRLTIGLGVVVVALIVALVVALMRL